MYFNLLTFLALATVWTVHAGHHRGGYRPYPVVHRFPDPHHRFIGLLRPTPTASPASGPTEGSLLQLADGPRPSSTDRPTQAAPEIVRRQVQEEPRIRPPARPFPQQQGPPQPPVSNGVPGHPYATILEGQGENPRGEHGADSASNSEKFFLQRDFGNGETVLESGSISDDLVVFKSIDQSLHNYSLTPAITVYDFQPAPLVAIHPIRSGACFLTRTNLTFQEAKASLHIINGSIAMSIVGRRLDGTVRPLTREQATAILQSNTNIRGLCEGKFVVLTTPEGSEATEEPVPGGTQEIRISTLEAIVTITVPTPPPGFRSHHSPAGAPGTK